MKKLISLSVFIVSILTFAGALQADSDIFSLNFYRYGPLGSQTEEIKSRITLEPDESAGFDEWNTTGWKNIDMPWSMSKPANPVTITSTQGSTAKFILNNTRNGGPYDGARSTLIGDGNADLMDGHGNGTEDPYDGTLIFGMAVTDIPQAAYDVIIYLGANKAQYGNGKAKIVFNGGPELEFTLSSGRFDGTFTEIVNSGDTGNYIVYKGVSGSSFSVQVRGNGFNHIGPCGFQFGVLDLGAPTVSAGSDWVTWSGEPVTLNDVAVTNNDTGAGDLTLVWSAEAVAGVDVDFLDANVQSPIVTITKSAPTDNATAVTLTLTVTQPGKEPIESSMTIDVYDDACKAALGTGTGSIKPADFNANCVTDMEDLARMAVDWLVDFTLEWPVNK